SSIGNVPLSYTQGERTTFLGIEASPVFNLENENHFKEIPVSFFFGLNPVSWFELSTKFSIHAQNGFVPVSLHGSAKFSAQAQISKKTQFSFAAIFRYGGVLNALQGAPGSESANAGISYSNGADVGNGLGVGIALGFDGSKLFGGLSTEYICGALRGNLGDGTHIWKNGLALEFHPMPEISLKAWAALNSLFTSDTSITGQKINMFRAIDTGLGASFMLGSSSAIIFVRTNALMYINDTNYISATLGLSCIF
ncbi:MAG: hypothetical protein IJR49_05870, partial [Treponema sp.]|nr:hypothetical protein [Treponema sp.]